MEPEGEDDKDGSTGVGAAGSEGGGASDGGVTGGGGGDCGWDVGETRGRSGGTEKGSERAALIGKWLEMAKRFGHGVVNLR